MDIQSVIVFCMEIIGTVAGDDSILVVIKPKETAPVVRKRILDMLQD